MTEKKERVYEKVGRAYVRLLAEKLRELEENQAEIRADIGELLGREISAFMDVDPRMARDFTHQIADVIDRYIHAKAVYDDVKKYLEVLVRRFEDV